jgi:Leucine-rich repeat (LRR) protein
LTYLSLNNNQLIELSSEIGNLTQLTYLDLYSNELTQLPVEIRQLTQLTCLYLCNNQLTQLPSEICNLTQLTTLSLNNNQLIELPTEIGNLAQLTYLYLQGNPIENTLNPIIQRLLQRIQNKTNKKTIYSDTQNVHSSSIQQSVKTSIHALMNYYNPENVLTYLDWIELDKKTKEIITEYMDCKDVHTMLDITFKELFIAIVIEMEKLSLDLQKEIRQRLNEEMQESECKCFTGRISRLVNCLSGYSDKVKIQISESEEIGNIISVIMEKRGIKTTKTLKEEVSVALKERGYIETTINEWVAYIE